MKIIGHTGRVYLAEVSEDDVAILLGFRNLYDEAYKSWRLRVTRGIDGKLEAGTEIQVREISLFWREILDKEGQARQAAATLEALGRLITTTLPTGIVPPPEKEEPPHEDRQA